jgi:hypothetical protein
MTTDNWLTTALIISNFIALLIGPVIAARITLRANQPSPTPKESQPKNLIQRIGGLFNRIFQSPWIIPPLVIIANVYGVVSDLRSSEPLTRRIVFFVALGVTLIFFQLLNMSVLSIFKNINAITREIGEIVGILKTQTELLEDLHNRTSGSSNGKE